MLLLISNISFSQNYDGLTRGDITNPGMYTVGTLVESDGLRNGPDYSEATLYYPTSATGSFPSIVYSSWDKKVIRVKANPLGK